MYKRIRELVQGAPRGLSIKDISEGVDLSRNSVTRYIDVLVATGHLELRRVGVTKLYYASQHIPLNTLLDCTSEALIMFDSHMTVIHVNKAFCLFMDTSGHKIMAEQPDAGSCHVLSNPGLKKIVEEALEKMYAHGEVMMDTRNGLHTLDITAWSIVFIDGSTGVTLVINDVTEKIKRQWALKERVKELTFLYSVSSLIEEYGVDVDTVLSEAVKLLPPAYQYPEDTCARITLDDQTYLSHGFKETEHCQTAELNVNGEAVGNVTVCYLDSKPPADEGPFLKEERVLIDAFALRVTNLIKLRYSELKIKD